MIIQVSDPMQQMVLSSHQTFGDDAEYAATSESITPVWKRYITSSNSFKRTVRISSPYAGTIELDDVKKALMNRVQHSSQNQNENTADSDGPLQIFSKEPTTQRMCNPLLADRAASKTDNDLQDTREAIWINQKDGGLDIKKECRKLYLDLPAGGHPFVRPAFLLEIGSRF